MLLYNKDCLINKIQFFFFFFLFLFLFLLLFPLFSSSSLLPHMKACADVDRRLVVLFVEFVLVPVRVVASGRIRTSLLWSASESRFFAFRLFRFRMVTPTTITAAPTTARVMLTDTFRVVKVNKILFLLPHSSNPLSTLPSSSLPLTHSLTLSPHTKIC